MSNSKNATAMGNKSFEFQASTESGQMMSYRQVYLKAFFLIQGVLMSFVFNQMPDSNQSHSDCQGSLRIHQIHHQIHD